ncbi:trimeric intracellular cation channel family protein [Pseudarthrobacter sp. J75]|uniref:trimeric intracellular cation channel family protein n=1 Tax=unclassified Pseudarthrobacter TaxID=2647000 RepID=UPI002E80E869|nr:MULTISPECIES: trimeric intracellular cation channel family protein [unclassified Pseudarthrobacter]MEE2523964.1 trimeric intracellular cation channel family protein [Pseudarthrobacter sp. J47]MEE2528268.1 trimeric intracellular cation channel family protein [Pseudarthrobacter sp. J75]MEE2567970.1 trimeric intracellular cation channel family protein [Pseudarthrobacter sp. J64]
MTFPFDIALVWLDLAGVFFFAVSGSLLAARKQFDIVGSLLLASLVSLGGGVIRDIILNTTPAAFTNPAYLAPPLLATALVYFLFSSVQRFTSLLVLFDAGGLALFCITGAMKALSLGMNPVTAILLGVTTAVGGGLLRDITANEVPQLFNPADIYALPAFLGASLTTMLWLTGSFSALTASAVAALVFTFRVVAWRRSWCVPLAVRGWHRLGMERSSSGS